MSALTEKVAREHASQGLVAPDALRCICGHRSRVSPQAKGRDLGYVHLQHVAEVTEAAVRAAVAADIRAATIQFDNSGCTPGMDYLLSEAYDKGLRVAARISEGWQS